MVAGFAGSEAGLCCLDAATDDVREKAEVREVADGENAGAERRGNGEVSRGGEVRRGRLRSRGRCEVVVQRDAKGGADLAGGAGEEDAVVAA